jgi:hypothetical protein
MLLLIDIFSINRSRGYENPSLDNILIERSTGGCPLEEACEQCFHNQSVIFVVLISFQCYCGDCSGYIVVILPLPTFYFHSAYFLYLVYYKWYQSTFLSRKCGLIFFFRVETYSDIFKPHRSIITCINPWLRDSYTQEIQVVLKNTFVGHPCNPCWYPFEW